MRPIDADALLERGKDYCEHCGARMKGADDDIDDV